PPMAGPEGLQSCREPLARSAIQKRYNAAQICVISLARSLRLVEKHDLGTEYWDTGNHETDGLKCPCDSSVAPVKPLVRDRFLNEDFKGPADVRRGPAPDLVNVWCQRDIGLPEGELARRRYVPQLPSR